MKNDKNSNDVGSVITALELLNLIANTPDIGLSEVARRLNLNKSRCYRLLTTLNKAGYVEQDANTKAYRLGYQAAKIGQQSLNQSHLMKVVVQEVDRLQQIFNESFQVYINQPNFKISQIYRRGSTQLLRVMSQFGTLRSLGQGASGKVLLAYAAEEVLKAFIQVHPQEPINQSELAQIQRDGFYRSNGELTKGVIALAVPIFSRDGVLIAAISCSLPEVRKDEQVIESIVNQLAEAAGRIGISLNSTEILIN